MALVPSAEAVGQAPDVAAAPTATLRAGPLVGVIQVDGALDEPAWQGAPETDALVAIEPNEGAAPSGRTVVRVLAGPKALVFGIRCEDPDAARIVSYTKERDGDLDDEDHVILVVDPFRDGLSGYVFAVNPGGARYDALVTGAGEMVNASWDGIWEAGTSRDALGWTAEIRIPIDSLSFASGHEDWAFNVQRRIQRLQETIRWASPNRD
ncbi:MAG TPA: carbohydrate binding family 9 domain-containing protein, partial [Vicinamibacteria bacterium]